MRWHTIIGIFVCFLLCQVVKAQINTLRLDTLFAASVKLECIDLRHGNTYRFQDSITEENLLFIMSPGLPRGYYEAYYDNDTNRLALAYYNFGKRSYLQQFYKDGRIKSDTEYDAFGNMHGLHILYDQAGDELWHVDYFHGMVEEKYTLEYLAIFNYTKELMHKEKAWGCYEFSPTPMRERHDQIHLKSDGTFSYHNFKADCDCRRHSEGVWTMEGDLLKLTVASKDIWRTDTKFFALIATHRLKRVRLIEILPQGLHWYASEYWYCRKCKCIEK